MARLQLQERLEALLGTIGNVARGQVPKATTHNLAEHPTVRTVYQSLGGMQQSPIIRFGDWDVEFDGFPVELDEQLHFNEYRSITLLSPGYADVQAFPLTNYQRFCVERRAECIAAGSYGNKWTSNGAARQFGPPGALGDLTAAGAPRWKQRAFYDFVKDMQGLVGSPRPARVAIWDVTEDSAGQRSVWDVLRNPASDSAESLARLARQRSGIRPKTLTATQLSG